MVKTIRGGYLGVFAVFVAMALLCVLATSSAAATGTITLVSVGDSGVQGSGSESDINGFTDIFVRDRDADADGVFDEVGAVSTERVSVDDNGNQANGHSNDPSISSDGRYVAFISEASDLVANDTNGLKDVFVHDLQAGTTQAVSVNSSGALANGESYDTDISDNGRVAFVSEASDLVAGDTNEWWDYFVRDLQSGTTERVNVDESGNQVGHGVGVILAISISANGRYVAFTTSAPYLDPDDPGDHWDGFVRDLDPVEGQTQTIWRVAYDASGAPRISDDGRVVFTSYATKLVANDTNGFYDIFVRDLPAGTIDRVSVDRDEKQANGRSLWAPSISSDGRYVAFVSEATNLVAGDTNGYRDVFVRDLQAGTTEQVSMGRCATQANGGSFVDPSISSHGRFVAFSSGASNLVADDTNMGGDVFVRDRLTESDTLPSECIAPTTTASASTGSGAPYGSGTWTNQEVKLTFSAQDNEGGSGIKDVRYSATGADAISQQTVAADDLPATFTVDAEGTTTVRYLATDKEGNVESPAKTFTVKIDKSPPAVDSVYPADAATDVAPWDYAEATFTEPMDPDSLTPSTFTLTKQGSSTPVAATVSYESDETSNVAWLLPSSNLASNTTYTATIKGGLTGAKALSGYPLEHDYSWTFTTEADTMVPDTTIDSGPSGAVSSTTASFNFSSNESDVTFECKLDNGAFESCFSPKSVPNEGLLAEGLHTFEVRAIDTSGNTDATPASRTWTVDAPPETTIVSGPSGYVKSTSASFPFSSPEAGSTFQCSRDGSAFSACTSPKSYSNLSQGNHTFQVRAIDKAGNIDTTPATRSWFVDTVLPKGTIAINGKDASTRNQSVTLYLSASDPLPASGVVSVRFRNENTTTWSDWLPYSSSHSWQLSGGAGTKTVYAQFKDQAGNVSATASDNIKHSP